MPELGETKKVRLGSRNTCVLTFVWHACVDCSKERWVRLRKGEPVALRCRSCGHKLYLQRMREEKFAPRGWEGQRKKQKDGAIRIRLYPQSFFYPMACSDHYVQEHRLVMAKYVHRCLLPWEIVHHRNGDRSDNRIENLELITDKRFHLVDSATKSYIADLKKRIEKLEIQVKLLQWRLNEREKTNVQEVL